MIIDAFNRLNTTSFRIVATVGLIYLTGLRYLLSGVGFAKGPHIDTWVPSNSWLIFLTALAGVEGAMLVAKRLTDYDYQQIKATGKQTQVQADTAQIKAEGDVNVTQTPLGTPIPSISTVATKEEPIE